MIAIDTETTGLDAFHGCRAFMVTAATLSDTWCWSGKVNPANRQVTWDQDDIKEMQNLFDQHDELVFHNAKFDVRMLSHMGINLPWKSIHDTALMSHAHDSAEDRYLKTLARKYVGIPTDDETRLDRAVIKARDNAPPGTMIAYKHMPQAPGRNTKMYKMDMWMAPKECEEYARMDPVRTIALYNVLKPRLKTRNMWNHYMIRRRLLEICYNIENRGLDIDYDELLSLQESLEEDRKRVKQQMQKLSGLKYTIDFNSLIHKQRLFYECMGFPVIAKTKQGKPKVDQATLDKLLKEHPCTSPELADRYIQYAKIVKQQSDLVSLKRWYLNGKIHSNIKIAGTRNTRQSASDPSQQTIDKKIFKKIVIPPPGYRFWYGDVDNIEMRIFAYSSGNKRLIQLFEERGSFHLLIFSLLYPREWLKVSGDTHYLPKHFKDEELKDRLTDQLYPEKYQKVKNGNFAFTYGASQRKVNATYQVKNAFNTITSQLTGVKEFIQGNSNKITSNRLRDGYSYIATLGGYKLCVDQRKPYVATNTFCQGSAGEIMTHMMIALADYNIVAQIHDALIIKLQHTSQEGDKIKRIMESAGEKFIPTCPVSWKYYDAKEKKEALH